jgi:hypothetical protein
MPLPLPSSNALLRVAGVVPRVTLPANLLKHPPPPTPPAIRLRQAASADGWEGRRGRNYSLSRRHAPELCQEFLVHPDKRGRRECRMLDAPAASRANISKHASVVTTGSPDSNRHSLRDGLTVTPWSPRCAGLVSHRRQLIARLASHQRRGARPPRLGRPQAAPSSDSAFAPPTQPASIASRAQRP